MSIAFTVSVVVAALFGWLLAAIAGDSQTLIAVMQLIKTVFLGGLKMVIGPLIFLSLLSGILRLRESAGVRRLGSIAVGYYVLTTGIATAVGLGIVFFVHPWTAHPPIIPDTAVTGDIALIQSDAGGFLSIMNALLQQALTNPIGALADTNMLGIVISAFLLGLAGLAAVPSGSPLITAVHDAAGAIYKLTAWIIWLLPAGVMAIIFSMASDLDTAVVTQLMSLALVVLLGSLFHALVILPAIAWFVAGVTPIQLFRAVAQPMLVAATTSSSMAALPVSLRAATDRLRVRPPVANFVLPLGATINMDGTALFEGVAAVFLAYLFNVPLEPAGMAVVFFVAMLSSMGAPGMPSGSMAGMQVVLLSVGIPLEGIGLLLLIERPLDTFRTAINVEGDLVGALVAERLGLPNHRSDTGESVIG